MQTLRKADPFPDTNPDKIGLTGLPLEILQRILRYCLLSREVIYRETKIKGLDTCILRVSRLLRRLGYSILYGENTFGIASNGHYNTPFFYFPGPMKPYEHVWKQYLRKCHITISSCGSKEEISALRQFVAGVCGCLTQVIGNSPDVQMFIMIDCQENFYQILEPFRYLRNIELKTSGVSPIYKDYLQAAISKSELTPEQHAYHNLQLAFWYQCACDIDLGSAWNDLQEGTDLEKRIAAWDVVRKHEYEDCFQEICPSSLYEAWYYIEQGNLEAFQRQRFALLEQIAVVATSYRRRWERLEQHCKSSKNAASYISIL